MCCKTPTWLQPIKNKLNQILLQNPISKFLRNYIGMLLVLVFDKIFLFVVFYEFYEAFVSWHETSTEATFIRTHWWETIGFNANTGESIGPDFKT